MRRARLLAEKRGEQLLDEAEQPLACQTVLEHGDDARMHIFASRRGPARRARPLHAN